MATVVLSWATACKNRRLKQPGCQPQKSSKNRKPSLPCSKARWTKLLQRTWHPRQSQASSYQGAKLHSRGLASEGRVDAAHRGGLCAFSKHRGLGACAEHTWNVELQASAKRLRQAAAGPGAMTPSGRFLKTAVTRDRSVIPSLVNSDALPTSNAESAKTIFQPGGSRRVASGSLRGT